MENVEEALRVQRRAAHIELLRACEEVTSRTEHASEQLRGFRRAVALQQRALEVAVARVTGCSG